MTEKSSDETIQKLRAHIEMLDQKLAKAIDALDFYGAPTTYFAIGFWPDPPCGEFMADFSDTEFGRKPGKLARETLDFILDE